MYDLYPLKFKPIFKDKIWGGDKIRTRLGLDFSPLKNCGEAWILSGHKDNPSVVSNGFLAGNELGELIEVYMGDLVGDRVFDRFGSGFPVLVKLIDTNDYLSVQVHPDDDMAWRVHRDHGKNEMWYILGAERDAELINGFSRPVTSAEYQKIFLQKNLLSILNREKVKTGDVFPIPAGRVHALGPGILLAEIQQTSDLTYRIYDWDRTDDQGRPRELHTDLALGAIHFDEAGNGRMDYPDVLNHSVPLWNTPWFHTSLIHCNEPVEKDYSELDSFVVYLCVEGNARIHYLPNNHENLKTGECLLVPSLLEKVLIYPMDNARLLEIYLD